ncbi:MAG: N-acetylmuramoyl-L-alanine amidase [Jatrophihabitans endophyticus]|nr:N-acetylmuramoyl-L-alanine amidase [Jatrophihabitans endophyticus]
MIVIDPGHCPSVHHIDRRTGLDVSDYENEPEMHDVYKVALIVRHQLQKAGYHVVMTKKSVDQRVNLAKRARIANRAHAALALSIHDQAGANGGIGFRQGNNTVYYQHDGDYRATPAGKKVYFRNPHVAKLSKRYGEIFRRQRARAQGVHINLQDNVGYNLGSRGLAPGNIWLVQLLSTVPWVYNEAGGNSSGRSGLDGADRHTYAAGLVAGVEHSVPIAKQH